MWMSMPRRGNRRCRRGLLLVEAVLSAVAIGVGLTLITRGLASQLSALKSIEEYDTLAALGRNTLLELEADRLTRPLQPEEQPEGAFPSPYQAYRWRVAASPRLEPDTGQSPTSELALTVERREGPSAAVELAAVWPSEWIPPTWE